MKIKFIAFFLMLCAALLISCSTPARVDVSSTEYMPVFLSKKISKTKSVDDLVKSNKTLDAADDYSEMTTRAGRTSTHTVRISEALIPKVTAITNESLIIGGAVIDLDVGYSFGGSDRSARLSGPVYTWDEKEGGQ